MSRRLREPALLAVALAAQFAPAPFSYLVLLASALVWLGSTPRPPRREAAVALVLAAAAGLALAGAGVAAYDARLPDRRWIERRAGGEVGRLWEGLRAEAAAAAGAMRQRPASPLAVLDPPLAPAPPAAAGAVAAATL